MAIKPDFSHEELLRELAELRQQHEQLKQQFEELEKSNEHADATGSLQAHGIYRNIIDSLSESIFVQDEHGVFIDVNRTAAANYGYPREFFIGKTPEFLATTKSDMDVARQAVKDAFDGTSSKIEFRATNKYNEQLIKEVNLSPGHYMGRKVVFAASRDVTRQREAERTLAESEAKYKSLFELANDAIFLMNQHVFLDCNEKTLDIFGCTREQIINHAPAEFSPEYQPDGQLSTIVSQHRIDEALKGIPQFFEWTHCKYDRTSFYAEISLNRVLINGEFLLQSIVRDISKRKKTESLLRQAEAKFNIISQNTNDVIWIRNLDLLFLYVSPSCLKVTGYTVEETLELSAEQIETEEALVTIYALLNEELERDGQPGVNPSRTRVYVVQERKKNGELIWTETQLSFIRDDNGKINGFLGVTRDISARKRVEEELRRSEERFRITAEKTGELIYEYHINSGKIWWSNAFEPITGLSLEESMRFDFDAWKSHLHPDDVEHTLQVVEKAVESCGDFIVEYRFRRKDGEYIHFVAQGAVLVSDTDGGKRLLGTINDITERKRAQIALEESKLVLKEQNEELIALNEELVDRNEHIDAINHELRLAKEKAEENDKLKSAFLANMSHEIRTPMNGIMGFAQLLRNPKLTPNEFSEYISIIESSGQRMLGIINDLVDISTIESGQMKITQGNCNILAQMEYAYGFFKRETDIKGLQFTYRVPEYSSELFVITDCEKFGAILLNLIKNAIKYCESGRIEFGFEVRKEALEFYVSDTGIGIEPEKQKLIFERFVQGHTSLATKYEGAGLGLAISKAYVHMLGGEIWVESEPGKGSIFRFTLPAALAHEEQAPVPTEERGIPHKLNILIADDDEVSDFLLSQYFEPVSQQLYHARNGLDAVDICRAVPDLDLILMDIKMPEMNGLEATKLIRKFNKRVIIIAQTAYALSGDRQIAIDAGCNDYIAKPVQRILLMEVVRKYFPQKV